MLFAILTYRLLRREQPRARMVELKDDGKGGLRSGQGTGGWTNVNLSESSAHSGARQVVESRLLGAEDSKSRKAKAAKSTKVKDGGKRVDTDGRSAQCHSVLTTQL